MQYKIAVSGAAEISRCCDNIILLSKEVGKEIARAHCVLISGATTGVPYFSAQGCKQAGGFNVGFSPASSEIEHLRRYRLPLDVFDVMIYTGADYSGRDIIMTKSADAIIIACGRMGTLHEFTTAVECGKSSAFWKDRAARRTKSAAWSGELIAASKESFMTPIRRRWCEKSRKELTPRKRK